VLAAVEQDVVVRLVGQDEQVALDAEAGQLLELVAAEDGAGRVAGIAEDDHPGARAGQRLERVEVEVVVGGAGT
jgi:hypothetical protein